MDLLRSCYKTQMNFGNGYTGEVQWFFTKPGAEIFPALTRFGSLNWLPEKTPDAGVGEVLGAPRVWCNGSYPIVPDGSHGPDGPLEDFLFGNSDGPLLALNSIGLPVNCAPRGAYSSAHSEAWDALPPGF